MHFSSSVIDVHIFRTQVDTIEGAHFFFPRSSVKS